MSLRHAACAENENADFFGREFEHLNFLKIISHPDESRDPEIQNQNGVSGFRLSPE
jgi:hypothetical protein